MSSVDQTNNKHPEQSHDFYKAEGDEHTRARRFELAEESYTWAISKEYTQHATWGNRSLVRLKLGDVNGAATDALRCTELAPHWPKGWARLGAAERSRHKTRDSIQAYRRAHELEPGNKEFIRLLHEVEQEERNQRNHHNPMPSPPAHRRSVSAPEAPSNHTDYMKPCSPSSSDTSSTNSGFHQPFHHNNCHHQMKPLPRLIPIRVLEAINLSIRMNPGGVWHLLESSKQHATNALKMNSNKTHQGGDQNDIRLAVNNLPSLSAIQALMSQCLEQLPLNERAGLDREEQLALMMATLESSPSRFPQLERLVTSFAEQRARLAQEAKRIVPTLPVYNEHWCCSSCDSSSLDSATGRPLTIVTVAVLGGPREGLVVGSEQSVEPLDGFAVLDVLWGAMAFPVPSMPPPRRPAGVLLCSQLIQHYAIIAGELLGVDIACRIESRTESETQRMNYDLQHRSQQQYFHHHHHHHHHHHQQHQQHPHPISKREEEMLRIQQQQFLKQQDAVQQEPQESSSESVSRNSRRNSKKQSPTSPTPNAIHNNGKISQKNGGSAKKK